MRQGALFTHRVGAPMHYLHPHIPGAAHFFFVLGNKYRNGFLVAAPARRIDYLEFSVFRGAVAVNTGDDARMNCRTLPWVFIGCNPNRAVVAQQVFPALHTVTLRWLRVQTGSGQKFGFVIAQQTGVRLVNVHPALADRG